MVTGVEFIGDSATKHKTKLKKKKVCVEKLNALDNKTLNSFCPKSLTIHTLTQENMNNAVTLFFFLKRGSINMVWGGGGRFKGNSIASVQTKTTKVKGQVMVKETERLKL